MAVGGVNDMVVFGLYFEPELVVVSDSHVSFVQVGIHGLNTQERMRNQRLEAEQALENLKYSVQKSWFVLQNYEQVRFQLILDPRLHYKIIK